MLYVTTGESIEELQALEQHLELLIKVFEKSDQKNLIYFF